MTSFRGTKGFSGKFVSHLKRLNEETLHVSCSVCSGLLQRNLRLGSPSADMTEYADRVRSAAQELKILKIFDVEHYIPPLQKLVDIDNDLRGKPKVIVDTARNVMADEGTAELFARALNELSGKDSPVPEENLRLIRGTVAVLTQYTSTSLKFGKAVGSCGLVKHLVNILKFKPLQDRLGEPMIREFLVSTIGVLSNISRVPENRGCLRQANVLDVMKIYSNMDDDLFKLIALQIAAHVVDSLDCDPLGTSKEAMKVLIETYKKHSVYGRYKSLDFIVFLTEELMETMFLLMTCGTERKKIMDAGAVPILVQCMKDGRYAEKQYAASGLRRLAQDPEICPQLREMGHNYGAFDYEGERVSQTTQCGFKNFVKAAWGVFSACGSTQGKEVPSNDPGVLKWGPPEVAEWLHSNGLGHYAQHFAEFDGKLFQKLLHLYQLAPEMFQMVIKEVAPLTCQDRMRFLRAVDRLLQ